MRVGSFVLALLCAALGTALPATAQAQDDTAVPAEHDAHIDLNDAMEEGVNKEAMFDGLLQTVAAGIVAGDPFTKQLEADRPGLTALIKERIRSPMFQYSERLETVFKPRRIAIFREVLTVEEAAALAAFYRTPASKKLLGGMSEAYSGEETIEFALSQPEADIDTKVLEADIRKAALKGAEAMTPKEQLEFGISAFSTPGMTKLMGARPKLMALRAEMENAPLTLDEETALTSAIGEAFTDYFASAPEAAAE